MKLVERSYYSVDRPPAKFRRIQSSFGSPTVIRIGTVAGLFVGHFGLQNHAGLHFSSLSSQLKPLSHTTH